MGISTVLLSYKEEENLRFLLPAIKKNLDLTGEEYEILVIDTKEPLDNTNMVCEQFGATYLNQEEPCFGGAFRTGIKYAAKNKFLILDSDGSHNPNKIPEINKKFDDEHCDVVIGSRYVKGGKTSDALMSILMSRILNAIFRICLDIKAKDISTDYRMYDTKQLKSVKLKSNNYDVLQEVLLKLKLNNKDLKIREVPITFTKRVYGESKRRLLPFIFDYLKSLLSLTCMRFSVLRNLCLYGCFGLAGALIEYTIFYGLTYSGLLAQIPEAANIVGSSCGFIFTFSANTYFNFKKKDKLIIRFCSYGCICLCGMLFSTVMIHFMKEAVNLYALKAVLLITVSIIQFIANKFITYRT